MLLYGSNTEKNTEKYNSGWNCMEIILRNIISDDIVWKWHWSEHGNSRTVERRPGVEDSWGCWGRGEMWGDEDSSRSEISAGLPLPQSALAPPLPTVRGGGGAVSSQTSCPPRNIRNDHNYLHLILVWSSLNLLSTVPGSCERWGGQYLSPRSVPSSSLPPVLQVVRVILSLQPGLQMWRDWGGASPVTRISISRSLLQEISSASW